MEYQYQQPNSQTAKQPNSQTAKFNQTSRPVNQNRYELNSGLCPQHMRIRHFYLISYFPQTFLPSVIPAKAGIQPELGIEHWIPAFAGMTVFSV